MEFDKSKVYTALNADELKVGSKVIGGNNLTELKQRVGSDRATVVEKLAIAAGEDRDYRFLTENNEEWLFVYLVEEPQEQDLKWTDLKVGDVLRKGSMRAFVICIDDNPAVDLHIFLGSEYWVSDEALKDWKLVKEDI